MAINSVLVPKRTNAPMYNSKLIKSFSIVDLATLF